MSDKCRKFLHQQSVHGRYKKLYLKGNKSQSFDHMGLIELIKSNRFHNFHLFNVSGLPGKNVEHIAIESL